MLHEATRSYVAKRRAQPSLTTPVTSGRFYAVLNVSNRNTPCESGRGGRMRRLRIVAPHGKARAEQHVDFLAVDSERHRDVLVVDKLARADRHGRDAEARFPGVDDFGQSRHDIN